MTKIKCPRTGCNNEAIINSVYGVLPCAECQKKDLLTSPIKAGPEFVNISKSNRVQHQRDIGAKDMIQPFMSNKPNPEFMRAFPKEAPKFFSKEEIKKI